MFATLKNKIKEETGVDLIGSQHRSSHGNNRSSLSSTISLNCEGIDHQQQPILDQLEQVCNECHNLNGKVSELTKQLNELQAQKSHLEETNSILLKSVKCPQTQKNIFCDEQLKIQDLQQDEMKKLNSLLLLRDHEATEKNVEIRQREIQIEYLTKELERLKKYESRLETLQEELERVQHTSQVHKNTLTRTLAATEEENRHLKMRIKIMEDCRLDALRSLKSDDKLQSLISERKLLEQRLEEAHLQLSDIKSSWSGQNLALETQVNRLSKQVAEESSEKRTILVENGILREKINMFESNSVNHNEEIRKRDNEIKLLGKEIDGLNSALKASREENEQQIIFERIKSEKYEKEIVNLKMLQRDIERKADEISKSLLDDNFQLKLNLDVALNNMETEREEKLTALLRNAEISQSEELLKQELRIERNEANDLHSKNCSLKAALEAQHLEKLSFQTALEEVTLLNQENEAKLQQQEGFKNEICEKNATIKMLNQRLSDLKKMLQFSNANSFEIRKGYGCDKQITTTIMNCKKCGEEIKLDGGIIMDEINFKYLKHVLIKFLSSREVESRHLVRAVATLLKLTREEERFLADTLHWKTSWFGSKPDSKRGFRVIPPWLRWSFLGDW